MSELKINLQRSRLIEHRDKPNSDPDVLSHERICLIDGAIELLDEIDRLEHEIEEWKTASGLEVGGDPMGVTPAMLEKRVSQDDRLHVEQELIYELIYSSPMLVGDDRAIDSTSSMVRNYITAADAKIARLESALASQGGKVDAEAIVAALPAEAIAVVVAFAINDHIKHPGPYCIDEIVGACEKISVDDISDVLPRPTPNED